ncbi:MAG: acyl-CoA dehydrogenase [Gammaproteobacteria bacterium]|nr:acyl-CoA dehydrogenase [Gammaproteobacteria bacterium]
MQAYRPPIADMLFNLKHIAQYPSWSEQLVGLESLDLETIESILTQYGRFCSEVIAPLNRTGDVSPSVWQNGEVMTTQGFKNAYRLFCQAGWQSLGHPSIFGGQGLPHSVSAVCTEMLNSANLSFALCPLLTDGAIEALRTAANESQQTAFLPYLVSGQWTGTMNLTEPQAGSDLAAIRSKAVPQADGSYKIFGNKIFITYGEHDLSENILHMVLARVEGAPAGIQGISLFLVPKYLQVGDTHLRNDVYCTSIEHKLGIKASPTAVLEYGGGLAHSVADQRGAGAVGYLVGQENHGLQYMFIMMNAARFAVGVQGIAISERAYQQAYHFSTERIQSRPVDGSHKAGVAIGHHPDVKRMLMTMRSLTQGCRSLAAYAAGLGDQAQHHADPEKRRECLKVYEFLVPLVKGYSTEVSLEVTSLGVQVHGGMGFIEETGAAQHYRDARILPIYEGTTAIQANDLVGRKTQRDAGAVAKWLASQVSTTLHELNALNDCLPAQQTAAQLQSALHDFTQVVEFITHTATPINQVYASSVPYLLIAGNFVVGWLQARSLLEAQKLPVTPFYQTKIGTAHFYCTHILPRIHALAIEVLVGAPSAIALSLEELA